MKTAPCRGCHAAMVWAKTPEGKAIPFDPRAKVYMLTEDATGHVLATPMPMDLDTKPGEIRYMVSHFKTCPKAAQFSGRNK